MHPNRYLCLLVAVVMLAPSEAVAASWNGTQSAQETREQREQRRNAEKAAKQAAEEAREYAETMRDVADELQELGEELLRQRYDDPFLQDYVNELGQSLVPQETPAGTLFSFRVLDNEEPNAFALPDGRIYINSGLLLFVENEAQLAVILGHEIGHVIEHHYVESVRTRKREQLISSVIGTAAGSIFGGIFGGKKGAAEGAAAGLTAGLVVAKLRLNSYSRKQEDEADAVGISLALDRHFDAREGIGFFQKLTDTYGDQGRFQNALYGTHSRNKDRMAYIEQLISGNLSERYNELRAQGELTTGTGQMYLYASRMVRDVSIALMDVYDQYGVAREHLEQIVDYRASDPRTLWALGRAYKRIGRTDEDRARALDLLQRAAQLDARNLHPYVHFDLGLMYARLGNPSAAVESLKKYVVNYVTRYNSYPGNLGETYDYLLTFGDGDWTAPAVEPDVVRARYPAEASGDAARPAGAKTLQTPPKKPVVKAPARPKPTVKKPGGGEW